MDQFKGALPYASELFGIYQPLLGWKSKITAERYEHGVATLYDAVGSKFLKAAASPVRVHVRDFRVVERRGAFEVENLEPLLLPDEELALFLQQMAPAFPNITNMVKEISHDADTTLG